MRDETWLSRVSRRDRLVGEILQRDTIYYFRPANALREINGVLSLRLPWFLISIGLGMLTLALAIWNCQGIPVKGWNITDLGFSRLVLVSLGFLAIIAGFIRMLLVFHYRADGRVLPGRITEVSDVRGEDDDVIGFRICYEFRDINGETRRGRATRCYPEKERHAINPPPVDAPIEVIVSPYGIHELL